MSILLACGLCLSMKYTWERPICICDVCISRRSPGEQKSEPHIEVTKEYCYRCGSIMQTFRIQCLASVEDPSLGVFDCVAKGKISWGN